MDTSAPARRHVLLERPHVIYLAVAYGFSWVIWITAWWLAQATGNGVLYLNESLIAPIVLGTADSEAPVGGAISWFAVLAVYGPLLGSVVAARFDPDFAWGDLWKRVLRARVGARWYGVMLGILALTAGPAAVIVALTAERSETAPTGTGLLAFLAVFLVYQFLSSATEEFGWRGYLNEKLRTGRTFWDTGWVVGLPWALWHLPVVLVIFAQQGLPPAALVGSLIGFGIGIVAMAILHAWFYEHTRSVFVSIVIHAVFNTIPLTTALLFRESPAAALANIALWVVVIVLKAHHDRQRRAAATA